MKLYHDIPVLQDAAIALGCFDGLHLGHQSVIACVLEHAANGLQPSVFSFSDSTPYKTNAFHLLTFQDKCETLADMGIRHLIVPSFDDIREQSPEAFFHHVLLERLGARFIAFGENYRFGQGASGDAALLQSLCEQQKIECKVIQPVMYNGDVISSSRIRNALTSGDIPAAAHMLGRLFSYKLEVVGGRHLGRTLGTPTINQYFPENFLIPQYGVYASVTEIGQTKYASVTNIGVKPTVGSDAPLSETWIPGFDGDLYGQHIRVNLVAFMRSEQAFHSIEELKEAILQDGINAKYLASDYL